MNSRAGIVLAGGRGRRMGQPKADIELDGVTLVDRAVAILRSAGCDPVVVADQGDDGPLFALADSVRALTADEVIVLACDLPLAGPVVARLTSLSVAVDPEDRVQPLCSRWPLSVLHDAAMRLVGSGERRMSALVDVTEPERVTATADELLNVNTAADLKRAKGLLASRR